MSKFEIRGVVEGFYGVPWSMKARKAMLRFLGEHLYNLYIYAPKDDELHRRRWREQYSEEFKKDFAELVAEGLSCGVSVVFAISPGLGVRYSSDSDIETLVAKLEDIAGTGVRSFAIFYDDIPETLVHEEDEEAFGSLAEAQAHFANTVYSILKAKVEGLSRFIVCPTQYQGRKATDYMKTLGEALDGDISIMWTGPEVCSERLSLEDSMLAEEAFQRKPLYWDNYPVNDASMVPELHVGPYEGRDPGIVEHSEGIVLNPMNQPLASKIALASAAEFLNNPTEYDVERAWVSAISEVAPGCSKEMELFCEYNLLSPIHRDHSRRIVELHHKLNRLVGEKRWAEVQELLSDEAEMIIQSAETLKEKLSEELSREVGPWLKEFSLWGRLMGKIADLISSRRLIFSAEITIERIEEVRDLCDEVESILVDLVRTETITAGVLFRGLAQEILIRTKGYLTLLIG